MSNRIEELKQRYLDHLTMIVNDMGYSYADGFFEDEECTEKEIDQLLSLNSHLSVIDSRDEGDSDHES